MVQLAAVLALLILSFAPSAALDPTVRQRQVEQRREAARPATEVTEQMICEYVRSAIRRAEPALAAKIRAMLSGSRMARCL